MLPYFEQPAWQLGPVTVHAFGVMVALAALVGLTMARRRFQQDGLDPEVGERLGGWMIVAGVLGAHFFSVLFYFPSRLRQDPWLILRVWEDISSFGGILGGILGAALFFVVSMRGTGLTRQLAYVDSVAFVFPWALAIGRIGCALAHDHPGRATAFPLAISLETEAATNYLSGVYASAGLALGSPGAGMGFHDLGLYELLFIALVILPLFTVWSRRRQPVGFYVLAFSALYFPMRFALDTLRVADARYVGLTPAQWAAATVMAALPFATVRRRPMRWAICGFVILVAAYGCWSGSQ
jgi:phosphatidylglycerol:prolipoprotein diacylglycerol transferase